MDGIWKMNLQFIITYSQVPRVVSAEGDRAPTDAGVSPLPVDHSVRTASASRHLDPTDWSTFETGPSYNRLIQNTSRFELRRSHV